MKRSEEILRYAASFKGKGMESEELKETIRLAIVDGANWADRTMMEKACEWLNSVRLDYYANNIDECIEDFKKAMKGE